MSLADELQKLEQLHRSGALSDAEFAKAKDTLMNAPPQAHAYVVQAEPVMTEAEREKQTREWAMILHLSLFSGYVVPGGGLVVPIVIWQVKKSELPGIDAHGKIVVNWIISFIIYALPCFILSFFLIGIPFLIALMIIGIIFPIIGGIKASNGELWKYPLSIPFFT
jgi:uncharacterized Tic20 family protein